MITKKSIVALMMTFVMLFMTACHKNVYREIENNLGVMPDELQVADITLNKGESKEIEVEFEPFDAYARYAFSVPVDRQSEISITNGVVKGLKAAATPVPVTCYALDESLDLSKTFNVKVNGYYDAVDGAIYALNRMGSFDYPVPATSVNPAATGWTVTDNGTEGINTLTLSHYDLEEEARDPNSTRWAPKYAHPAVEKNNVKIFDQFEFNVTFSTTLANVPAGKWNFSVFMEGNNVQAKWNITGLEEYVFPVAASPSWYYQVLELTAPATLDFSLQLIGETTNPDDDKTSPWIFFDSIRAVNGLNIEFDDDVPAVVEISPYTNYVKDSNFGAAETNVPLVTMTEYPWKVGNSLRSNTLDLNNSELDVVSSDTNFQVDANGKSGKFKTVVSAGKTQRFSLYQDLSGIPHNFFSFTAYFMGNPDNQTRENQYFRMFVTYKDVKGVEVTVYKNVRTESYMNGYIKNTMEGIEITDGKARIGIDFYRSNASTGGWGNESDCWFQFDDVSFIATNQLNEEEIDIFNTWGLTQLLPTAPDLGDVSTVESTGWTGNGENATASIDTAAANSAVGANSIKIAATAATTYTLTQTVTGLNIGETYVLSSHMKSSAAFDGFVSADGQSGTIVSNSMVYLQSYIEFTATATTAELAITAITADIADVYLDWVIFTSTSIVISVENVANIWVGDSLSTYVQFIPSSKAAACNYVIQTESVPGAVTISDDGVISAIKAGVTTIAVTHPASGATTTFTVTSADRPLLTSISVENKVKALGSVISTKLLLVTKTPATAIMGTVTYSIAEGSEAFVSLQGTKINLIAAGVAIVNVTALDVNGTPVNTSFTVTVQTIQEANRIAQLASFNAGARNNVSFADGGWKVISNNGENSTPTFGPNNIFGGSLLWIKNNPANYNFMLQQSFTNMQAGNYTFNVTLHAAKGGTGTITFTAVANDVTGTLVTYTSSSAATKTATATGVVAEDGGTLTISFSISGNLTGSSSLWGNGVTAVSLTWAPIVE